MSSTLYHILNKENHTKNSHKFLNALIRANNLIIKVLIRSFIMLNTIMENKSKTLREKCPNTELLLVRIFLYLD